MKYRFRIRFPGGNEETHTVSGKNPDYADMAAERIATLNNAVVVEGSMTPAGNVRGGVRSVEGIFRKLGYDRACEFLCDYVNGRVCGAIGAPTRSIIHLLETTRSNVSHAETHADAAVKTFNEMKGRGDI